MSQSAGSFRKRCRLPIELVRVFNDGREVRRGRRGEGLRRL